MILTFPKPVSTVSMFRCSTYRCRSWRRTPSVVVCFMIIWAILSASSVRQMTDKATVEGEKAAATFLLSIGVELIEWPHSWTSPDGEKNMAVLDDAKVRIQRIEQVALDEKGHQLVPGSQQLIKEFQA